MCSKGDDKYGELGVVSHGLKILNLAKPSCNCTAYFE
jgi:hypothetical protein